jgi:hypothetical protein
MPGKNIAESMPQAQKKFFDSKNIETYPATLFPYGAKIFQTGFFV